MIVSDSWGVSPNYSILFDNVPFEYQSMSSIKLMLEENVHDMLVISVRGVHPRAITEYLGAGVYFNMKLTGPYAHTFVGKVIEVDAKNSASGGLVNRSKFQDAKITCMGASYDMRGPRDALWDRANLQGVSSSIARRYGFSLDVPRTRVTYPRIMQTNESDWQFLVRYASMHGMVVTCHGTHIHIFDPYKAVLRNTSLHRISPPRSVGASPFPGDIIEFDGYFVDKRRSGEINNPVVTVTGPNSRMFDVSWRDVSRTKVPERRRQVSRDRDVRNHQYVETYEEAVAVLSASNKEVYDYGADVSVASLLGCLPGGVVDVLRYNGEFDGLWYVSSVTHNMVNGKAHSNLKLKRNKNSQLKTTPVESFRGLSDSSWRRPFADGEGEWRAVKQRVRIYS